MPKTDRAAYFAQFGYTVHEGDVIAGIAARLDPVKDIPTLIRAVALAKKACPQLRLAIAGDGKLIIDDNSVWRQPSYPLTRDYFDSEVEFEAAQEGIPYLQFNGDIALMCAGAGLTTTVFDLINDAGGHPATYVEFGGANYTKAVRTMELCLKTPSKVILVVTFGTIARADVMAQGLVEAIKAHQPKQPIVTCIRGTNEEEAFAILRDAGLEPLTNTEEAVQRAVDIAAGRA